MKRSFTRVSIFALTLSFGVGIVIPAMAADTLTGKCVVISRPLSFGARGDDVTKLQQFLSQDATIYPQGIVSGYFGLLTQAAVQKFQVRYGIVTSGTPAATGYGAVGPKTRLKLAGTCSGTQGSSTGSVNTTPGTSFVDLIHGVSSGASITTTSTSSPAGGATTCTLSLVFVQTGMETSLALSWSTKNATSGTIMGIGPVATTGSIAVAPTTTTTYLGAFNGPSGVANCSTTVQVNATQ